VSASTGDELVDWVDEQDRVLSVVTRARMRRERLRHRAVFVAVLDGRGRVVVHQRAAWKDVWPSAWDVCFGGVVAASESWVDAARRELAEEAGVHAEPVPLGEPFRFDDEAVSLIGRSFVVTTDEPVRAVDGEVAAIERVPLSELAAWCRGRQVCPDSLRHVLPALSALRARCG